MNSCLLLRLMLSLQRQSEQLRLECCYQLLPPKLHLRPPLQALPDTTLLIQTMLFHLCHLRPLSIRQFQLHQ
ncbi:hypothetical protein C6Q23_10030 [Burkholderia multivorans]|nr:hypothetical protein C6Q23_10030 [Burkholderia multivorans]